MYYVPVESIVINERVRVPAEALSFRAVRSGGPGGQNVNKVASKVELRVALERIEGLAAAATARLRNLVRHQLDAEGRWMVISERTRDQSRNLEDARSKIQQAIEKALIAPKTRRPTKPTHASKTRRLEAKKHEGEKKRSRRGSWE